MPKTYSIQPVTLTWQHNTYVTIGLEISADGALRAYKASGGGTANNMKVCYPQSDTFVQANVITKIDIPQSEGQHSMAITVWWDNQSGQNNDHNNHTITFTVVSEGSSDNNKVVLSDGTVLIDLTADTVDAEHLLQGYTAHDKSGALITGTASGGGEITIEPLSVTANGVYTAASGKAYTPVTVSVSGGDVEIEPYKTLTLSSAAPSTVRPSTGYDGIGEVRISIDSNVIKAANIAQGVTILGVQGTHSGGGSVDETEYSVTATATKSNSLTFSGLRGQPREWRLVPANFSADSYSNYYINGGVKTNTGATMFVCHGSFNTYNIVTSNSTPTYSNGSLTIPTGNNSYNYRASTVYTLYYKL